MANADEIQRETIIALLTEIRDLLRGGAQAPARASAPPAASGGGPVFRFGKTKGRPLAGAPVRDLEWYRGAIAESLNNPDKARYRDDNLRHLAEIDAVLGGPEPAPAPDFGTGAGDDGLPF